MPVRDRLVNFTFGDAEFIHRAGLKFDDGDQLFGVLIGNRYRRTGPA